MTAPIRILLQTTIPPIADDRHIGRFSMLRDTLAGLMDANGMPMTRVTARDRDTATGPDAVLSTIDTSDYDELWLFAVTPERASTPRIARPSRAFARMAAV